MKVFRPETFDHGAVSVPPCIGTARLDLHWLSPELMRGLLDGAVTEIDGAAVSEPWREAMLPRLRMRFAQIEQDPRTAPFLLRTIVERGSSRLIGHIGFHGPPGANALAAADSLELGYGVAPLARRQGYATEAVLGMMDWAAREHRIRRFLASVGPWNAPSLRLVAKLGFVEVARVMDEEDGLEIVFELRR